LPEYGLLRYPELGSPNRCHPLEDDDGRVFCRLGPWLRPALYPPLAAVPGRAFDVLRCCQPLALAALFGRFVVFDWAVDRLGLCAPGAAPRGAVAACWA
jgi:hypothetical protein